MFYPSAPQDLQYNDDGRVEDWVVERLIRELAHPDCRDEQLLAAYQFVACPTGQSAFN